MALTHTVEIKPYLSGYILRVTVTDTVTGKIYTPEFKRDHDPDTAEQDAFAILAKTRIQAEIDYQANVINLREDKQQMVEHLDGILRDIVLRIRADEAVELSVAQTYIDNRYPNSIVDFPNLYQFYMEKLGLSEWDDFKDFVIDNSFREVD